MAGHAASHSPLGQERLSAGAAGSYAEHDTAVSRPESPSGGGGKRRGAACTGRSRAPTDASPHRLVRPRPLKVDANSKLTSSTPKVVFPAQRGTARHAPRRAGAQ